MDTDYFNNEYASIPAGKGMSSPADTPYEPSSFIRSKRSSRATLGSSSRDNSSSPPPPLPDATDFTDRQLADAQQSRPRISRESSLRSPPSNVDPRRFTPTLHASLVSEILNLRRELDSKNHLVENLETSLSNSKAEADHLHQKLSDSTREVRKAKSALSQIEQGTLEAVETLAQDRDAVRGQNEDLRIKLESLQKKVRQQDEDSLRTQKIWEEEKEAADQERRGLERRLHVTESRLRVVVEEMTAQQTQFQQHQPRSPTSPTAAKRDETQIRASSEDTVFRDSALGNDEDDELDSASVRSSSIVTPAPKSRRQSNNQRGRPGSSMSVTRATSNRSLMRGTSISSSFSRTLQTPEPQMVAAGNSLADELGGDDEEDEYLGEEDEQETPYSRAGDASPPPRTSGSRQGARSPLTPQQRSAFGSPPRRGIVATRAAEFESPGRLLSSTARTNRNPVVGAKSGVVEEERERLDAAIAASAVAAAALSGATTLTPPQSHAPAFGTAARDLSSAPAFAQDEPVLKKTAVYVDRGYQPSPPPSPKMAAVREADLKEDNAVSTMSLAGHAEPAAMGLDLPKSSAGFAADPIPQIIAPAPMSPPESPVIDDHIQQNLSGPVEFVSPPAPSSAYTSTSTQTEPASPPPPSRTSTPSLPSSPTRRGHKSNQDSLSPPAPMFAPMIAIHPPNTRPSSPQPYVLPPGTKNVSCQADLPWPGRDAGMQTEEIRIDRRVLSKLAPHLLGEPAGLLPSPSLQNANSGLFATDKQSRSSKRASGISALASKARRALSSTPPRSDSVQSPTESSPEDTRGVRGSARDPSRAMPLKALPFPRPVLSPPPLPADDTVINGPLNRSSQYGVKTRSSGTLDDISDWTDEFSFFDEPDTMSDFDTTSISGVRAIPGRNGVPDMPKSVPEHREMSPDDRPQTAGSTGPGASSRPTASSKTQKRANTTGAGASTAGKSKYARSRSPSFGSAISSNYSTQSVPMNGQPPYPIPLRSSSKTSNLKSGGDDGTTSPTPGDSASSKRLGKTSTGQSLRKVQSAASIRKAAANQKSPTKTSAPMNFSSRRRGRLRSSPDLTPVQSMAFESPVPLVDPDFPLPIPSTMVPEILPPLSSSGLPQQGQRGGAAELEGSLRMQNDGQDRRAQQQQQSGVENPSSVLMDEANLVDSIAATMVGEWMWKYIRKRKSFGITGDDNASAHSGNNGKDAEVASSVVSSTGDLRSVPQQAHGTRHKRWVWLSPYERTIMWDTKQPTSGSALLGRRGRKLLIQSVLDVQDPTPLPKQPELASAFGRSILILTPERALKFTAVDEQRHILWMTALSFLAQNNQSATRVPQQVSSSKLQPPPQPIDGMNSNSHASERSSPAFGRSNVRDSIRLAKGKRPEPIQTQPQSPANNGAAGTEISLKELAAMDGADFPSVPRLYVTTSKHQRKRSNTLGTPRLPQPLNPLRSFSTNASPVTSQPVPSTSMSNNSSAATFHTQHHHNHQTSNLSASTTSFRLSSNYNNKSSIAASSPDRPNFFEAVGTVRMEAFVDPSYRDGVVYVPAPPPPAPGTGDAASGGRSSSNSGVFGFDFGPEAAPPPPGIAQGAYHQQRRRGRGNSNGTGGDRRAATGRRAFGIADDGSEQEYVASDPFHGF